MLPAIQKEIYINLASIFTIALGEARIFSSFCNISQASFRSLLPFGLLCTIYLPTFLLH
jgi:hypothetical protein